VRPTKEAVVIYKFGDASGCGFGSSLLVKDKILYKSGQWNKQHSVETSNYRELSNFVYFIEEAHQSGLLHNTELFVFTDNSMAEAAFFKGTSSSKKLFQLVLRLQCLQMHGNLIIHFIHVAGKRMMAQGTDGFSRGVDTEGIMNGSSFLSFVPLNETVLERQPQPITSWVESWFGVHGSFAWITPNDWYHNAHFIE
jgi:hypothetical protein